MINIHDYLIINIHDYLILNIHDYLILNIHDYLMINIHDCLIINIHDYLIINIHDYLILNIHDYLILNIHDYLIINFHDYLMIEYSLITWKLILLIYRFKIKIAEVDCNPAYPKYFNHTNNFIFRCNVKIYIDKLGFKFWVEIYQKLFALNQHIGLNEWNC